MNTQPRYTTACITLAVLLTAGAAYADLSDGLMAHYPFNGNTNDATGNYPALTAHEAVSASDRFGNANGAYRCDGVDDYISGSSYDIINPGAQGSFAVSFWFSPLSTWDASNNPNAMLVGNAGVAGPPGDWGILTTPGSLTFPSGVLYFWWLETTSGAVFPPSPWTTLVTTTNTWGAGTWYHVLYQYEVSTKHLSVWINGQLQNETTMLDDIGRDSFGDNLVIGRYHAQYADMSIDELRLYNRSLSENEIRQLAETAIAAGVALDPDTLNLGSKGKWITCYIDLPEGYVAGQIDPDSILLEGLFEAEQSDIQDGRLMVKFDRGDLILYIEGLLGVTPPADVELEVTGQLDDGTDFEGTDTIHVIDPSE